MHDAPAGTVAVVWDDAATPLIALATHEDGSFVVVDGELFAAEPPAGAPTAGDVLGSLRRGGPAALLEHHFEAAITWWDASTERLTVLRDHGGVVQLLVGRAGSTTVWSTDPDDLLAAGVAREPDRLGIDQLATVGWVTPPRSYWRDVQTVAAGHLATIEPGRPAALERWYAHTGTPRVDAPIDELATRFTDVTTTAIERRAGARLLGATLSAGVDSTFLVAIARRVLDLHVETFTFRYHGYEGQLNEDEIAADTASALGAPHTVIHVRPEDLSSRFSAMVAAFQSPITFGVHSFAQEAIADAGVDVVLGGSDPGFWPVADRRAEIVARARALPAGVRTTAASLASRLRQVPKLGAAHWAMLHATHPLPNAYLSRAERRAMFGRDAADAAERDLGRAIGAATASYADEVPWLRVAFTFEQHAVPQYVGQWNHRWARAHGLAIRAPFWDHDVMAFADRRWPWAGDKPMIRVAASRLVGDRAYHPKIYQEVPLTHWFRGPLRDFVEDGLSRERVERAGLFDHAAVRALVDDHLAGNDRHWPLWQLLTAVEWAHQLRGR